MESLKAQARGDQKCIPGDVGTGVEATVGAVVGVEVGTAVGIKDGTAVGVEVGVTVGIEVGAVGDSVGEPDGNEVGAGFVHV